MLIALSIHVEGWMLEADEPIQFDNHVEYLLELARAATDHGAVITYELSPEFTEAVTNWGSDVLDELTGMGHEIAIHADAGGRGTPSLAAFTAELERQVSLFEATGYTTRHVSGICSRGPWVEAAVAAGFTSMAGGVEYCLTSLASEYVPSGYEWISGCANPSVCHGPVPVAEEQAATGWWASSSQDWIVDRDEGDLLLLTGGAGARLSCFQWEGSGACPDQAEDLATLDAEIDEYIELAGSSGSTTVLPLTWSVGHPPAEGFAEALFASVEAHLGSGDVQWSGLPSAAQSLGA